MTVSGIIDVLEHYKSGAKQADDGLDGPQSAALRELWGRLLAHMDATADAPIAVDSSLARSGGLAAAGVSADDAGAVDEWYRANKSHVEDVRFQSVQDRLHLDGAREQAVPAAFRPLFGDAADSRRFAHAFWQACMRLRSPDAYLLSFLRAHEWKVDVAFARIVASVVQRVREEVDRLMWAGDLGINHGLMQKGLLVQVGTDQFGHPVVVVHVRLNMARERCDGDIKKFSAYMLEKGALQARATGRAMLVYNFTDFKLENVDTGFSKTIITRIGELYPQTFSGTLLFVNSWLFSGIWKILRGWMEPAIAKRTAIVKDTDALTTFVARDQIIAEMGGDLKFTYSYVYPTRAANAAMFDAAGRAAAEDVFVKAVAAFDAATRAWVAGPAETAHDAPPRAAATAALDAAAAALDPYMRARFPEERV
ncbi:phosphatidylinositol transfer protein csr1 [Coemansia nantahalensis]|nr:phosphatidylinositol transfer protein csr1 [Coemansia nantahalensis]